MSDNRQKGKGWNRNCNIVASPFLASTAAFIYIKKKYWQPTLQQPSINPRRCFVYWPKHQGRRIQFSFFFFQWRGTILEIDIIWPKSFNIENLTAMIYRDTGFKVGIKKLPQVMRRAGCTVTKVSNCTNIESFGRKGATIRWQPWHFFPTAKETCITYKHTYMPSMVRKQILVTSNKQQGRNIQIYFFCSFWFTQLHSLHSFNQFLSVSLSFTHSLTG